MAFPLAVFLGAGLHGAPVLAASPLVRVAGAASLPANARVIGAVPAGAMLDLTVALRPRDPAGLRALAIGVSTPGDPRFRRYLGAAAFAQRFGAGAASVAALGRSLRSSGLTVGPLTGNRLAIPVRGRASAVEAAFSTRLSRIRLPGGRTGYADVVPPRLPSALASYVQGVVGLDDLSVPQPAVAIAGPRLAPSRLASSRLASRAAASGPRPCPAAVAQQQAFARAGFTTYTADQIAGAYGLSSLQQAGDLGAGQTVALVSLLPFSPSDVSAFQSCYGTNVPVSTVGTASGPPSIEGALDIEQVAGLAPQAHVVMYEGVDNAVGLYGVLNQIVSDDSARVISSSYGECESEVGPTTMAGESTLLMQAAAQGQTFLADSGDAGSSGCSTNSALKSQAVTDPASQPFATGVGATTLESATQPITEGLWNEGVIGTMAAASGGGVSQQWSMPSYQQGAAPSLGVVNSDSSGALCASTTFCREVPDVSADGDPATGYDFFLGGGWTTVGGTSASTPLWASLIALVNASAACRGVPVGFANPALYQIAGTAYGQNFNDVTRANPRTGAGTNDVFGVNGGLYPVGAGYDMTTGLGTPIGHTLARSLCAPESPVYTVSVGNPGTRKTTFGHRVSLAIRANDSGAVPLSYSATGLPAGLRLDPSTGVITGTPTRVGTTTVTVNATDGDTNQGAIQFSWAIVAGSPTVTRTGLARLGAGRPKLTFTVEAGAGAADIKLITIKLPTGIGFAKSRKSLARGVLVHGAHGAKAGVTLGLRRGVLNVTLKRAAPSAMVSIAPPALTASAHLAAQVKHHRVRRLSIHLNVFDARLALTTVPLKLKVA